MFLHEGGLKCFMIRGDQDGKMTRVQVLKMTSWNHEIAESLYISLFGSTRTLEGASDVSAALRNPNPQRVKPPCYEELWSQRPYLLWLSELDSLIARYLDPLVES